jgi:serine/threonine-protein kinase
LKFGPGHVLDGRFRLLDEIGRGGMAIIFKAEDLENDHRVVAVKVPLPLYASGLGAWSMFQREEEIGQQLDHPYLLKFVRLAPDRRRNYIVTEYLPGRSLTKHLQENRPIPEREALVLASKLCDAVEYLHQHDVVHYDIKPGNIIECPDGTIRLIDFGLAHPAVSGRFSLSAAPILASADCAAPEQIRRRGGQKSVDVYAIGSVLYKMLTGQTPFPGDDPFAATSARLIGDPPAPRTLNPNLSLEVEEIVLHALRRNPRERYASAAAMKLDLDHPERVVLSGFRNKLQPVTPWRRRLRRARQAGLMFLLPIALQVGLFLFLWWHFARPR